MSQTNKGTKKIQILIISLVVIIVLIITVGFLILAYPSLFAPQNQSPAQMTTDQSSEINITLQTTLTPSPSRTYRPSSTPTITLTPTQTAIPTITPTLSGPPTLTPAKPVKGDPYQLVEWSPELADYMVELMNDYPNTLPEESRGENNENYYNAYFYSTIALKEALLQFPDAPQADRWQWELAYNLAQINDLQAGELYSELIAAGLNQGETDVDGLNNWLQQKEPRLFLYSIILEPLDGYLNSYLLDLRGPGSMYFLLLETPSAFQNYILTDRFDFVNTHISRSFIADLTGDGNQEIGIYYIQSPETGIAQRPTIFSIAELPPKELPFRPSVSPLTVGVDFESFWGIKSDESELNDLYFETSISPACPTTISQDYQWEGRFFELKNTFYVFEPQPDTINYCQLLVDHAVSNWGYAPAIQLMEILLPYWPPAEDINGNPYPADTLDEWRYKLGIYHAQLGNFEVSRRYLSDVANNPNEPGSKWVSEAQKFLNTYQQPGDFFSACILVTDCNPTDALDYLFNTTDWASGEDSFTKLWQAGAAIRSSGYFDFDLDGTSERWFAIRYRDLEPLNLWIIAGAQNGKKALNAGTIETNKPTFTYFDEKEQPPVVIIDGTSAIRMERDTDTFEPYLTIPTLPKEYENKFIVGMNEARDALFNGEDPAIVIDMLLDLQIYPGLTCETTWTCDPYYYYLGLAYELLGDEENAKSYYLYLWWNYSKSPFTVMARLKLQGTITPTPPTPTAIVTPPTMTVTPPPGATPTATPTGQPAYPTPTQPPYPFETPTIPYPFYTPTRPYP
jgi:hypothetical protein